MCIALAGHNPQWPQRVYKESFKLSVIFVEVLLLGAVVLSN